MFMVLAWVYTSAMVVKSIVFEKEQRIKETLGVMGLSNGVHWAGWFIDSFCSMSISFTCLALILVVRGRVAVACCVLGSTLQDAVLQRTQLELIVEIIYEAVIWG